MLCGLLVLAADTTARAQDPAREAHWGVSASLVPQWSFPRPLARIWNLETDMRGAELRVGVVRGSDRGGDWGFSYVKKTIDDDSVVQLRESACIQMPGGAVECARGAFHITRQARMTGVETHLFMPFGTIRGRVQIGMTFAGGVARIEGASDRFLEHLVVNGASVSRATDALGSAPFKATLQDIPADWSVVPIGRAELGVAFIVRSGVKIRLSNGVNFPGYHKLGVHLHFLFGAG